MNLAFLMELRSVKRSVSVIREAADIAIWDGKYGELDRDKRIVIQCSSRGRTNFQSICKIEVVVISGGSCEQQ